VLAAFEGGRLVGGPATAASDRLLRRLARELAPAGTWRDLARVFLASVGPRAGRGSKGASDRELRARFERITS
jgi:hypothetical protein